MIAVVPRLYIGKVRAEIGHIPPRRACMGNSPRSSIMPFHKRPSLLKKGLIDERETTVRYARAALSTGRKGLKPPFSTRLFWRQV